MRSSGTAARFHLFEEPDDNDAAEAEEREPAEDVNKSPIERLALKFPVEHRLRWVGSIGMAEESAERLCSSAETVLEVLAGDGNGIG